MTKQSDQDREELVQFLLKHWDDDNFASEIEDLRSTLDPDGLSRLELVLSIASWRRSVGRI